MNLHFLYIFTCAVAGGRGGRRMTSTCNELPENMYVDIHVRPMYYKQAIEL